MQNIAIKICGLTAVADIAACADAGASHIGLVHFAKSPRHVSAEQAAMLRASAPAHLRVVLLTVDMPLADHLALIAAVRPDIAQLHGAETPAHAAALQAHAGVDVWKALPVKSPESLEAACAYTDAADLVLYDAPHAALPGGNGLAFDWGLLRDHRPALPWGLAGGLNAGNVGDAIRATGAPLVDTSSGVESAPGVKDASLIRAFCDAARSAAVR